MNIGDVLMVVKLEDAIRCINSYGIDEIQKDDMEEMILLGLNETCECDSFTAIALTMKKTNKKNKEQIRIEEINNSIPVVSLEDAQKIVTAFYRTAKDETGYIYRCLIRDYELECVEKSFLARPLDIKLEPPMCFA